MRPLALSISLRSTALIATLGLALGVLDGCSGFDGAKFPSASAIPTTANIGSISGNVYGGHAPLVGAHVYLVQPGQTGPGSVVTSILTTNANASSFPLYTTGSFPNTGSVADQFVPAGFQGVLSNSAGEFYISGDYTCTVGLPVIMIAYGGSPSYVGAGAGSNAFNVTNESVTLGSGTNTTGATVSGGLFTYTVNSPSPELFYIGETVTVTGNTGANVAYNQSGIVQASGLSTTGFTMLVAPYSGGGSPVAPTGVTATGAPTFNPAAVNMAVLGNCPSNGTFATGPSAIKYLYMNEVSTVATAYAFNGFIKRGADTYTGVDEFHIGTSGTTPPAGLANAAITAALLYDIQGSNTAVGNPDGDVHIARITTPGGTGTVPQTTIDNLGNILAACVDSNNTYLKYTDSNSVGTGIHSPQCTQLGYYAPDNGNTSSSLKHQTANIAQAAFAIAGNPQIDGAASVSALYSIPSGNVPFTPQLGAVPNDWTIFIGWNTSMANNGISTPVQDVAIDSQGNAWAQTRVAGTNQVFEFTPGGTITGYTAPLISPQTEQIAIDINDHPWVAAIAGNYQFTAGTTAGTLVGVSAVNGGGIALDSTGNQYDASSGHTLTASLVKQNANGTLGFNTGLATNCGRYMDFVTLDSANLIWTATANPTSPATAYICRYGTSGGTAKFSYQLTDSTFTLPHFLATDMTDNVWFAEKNGGAIYTIAAGSTSASGVNSIPAPSGISSTGGGPVGVMIDGNNLTWIGYQNLGSSNSLGGFVQYSSPYPGGTFQAQTPTYLTGGPLSVETTRSGFNGIAGDPSGNIWVASAGPLVYEYVGLATPTSTPLVYAKANSKTGTRP